FDSPRDDGGEHGLEIQCRADSLAHFVQGPQLTNGAGQLAGSCSQFTEKPRVLHRDYSLVGKSLDQFDLLVGERLDFELMEDHDADDVVATEHRNAKFGADRISVTPHIALLRIRLDVRNMNRPSLERDSRRNAMTPWCDGMVLDEIDQLRGDVVVRRAVIRVALPSHNHPTS